MIDPSIRQRLLANAALLFTVGLATGGFAAFALTGQVHVAMPRLVLASHISALLGALWMVAVAWSLDLTRFSDVGARRLALLVAAANWGNWATNLIAAFAGRDGLRYTGEARNDVVAALLQVFVVLPALVGAGAWAWGLRGRAAR